MRTELFIAKVNSHLCMYKRTALGVQTNGSSVQGGKPYECVLPVELTELNFLPLAQQFRDFMDGGDIEWPKDSNKMNSSSVMCINFFAPLILSSEGLHILAKIISAITEIQIDKDARITNAVFKTSFAANHYTFLTEFSNGKRFLFIPQYAEPGLPEQGFIESMDCHAMAIAAGQDGKKHEEIETIVFCIPKESDRLYSQVQSMINRMNADGMNGLVHDWSRCILTALQLSVGTKYYLHYKMFSQKYLLE